MIEQDEDVTRHPDGDCESSVPKPGKDCRDIPEPEDWRPLGYEW